MNFSIEMQPRISLLYSVSIVTNQKFVYLDFIVILGVHTFISYISCQLSSALQFVYFVIFAIIQEMTKKVQKVHFKSLAHPFQRRNQLLSLL